MPNQIKVLNVIEALEDFGGTSRKLLCLAKYSHHVGLELAFLCFRDSPLQSQFAQYEVSFRNEDTIAPHRLVPAIAAHARRIGAHVICTHFSRPLLTGHVAARLLRMPHVHYEHSSAYYRKGLARLFSRYCLSGSDLVICNSRHTADSVARIYRFPPDRLTVIYNPVEPRQVTTDRESVRRSLGLGSNDPLLGHVGGMIRKRDQKTLIRAFKSVLTLHPSARLILIGDGPERPRLESLAHSLDLGNAIVFLGYTDRVADYLSAMDLYVNPTIDEGFGIAVVEAMLAQLPVVLADRGAHPELVVDGASGVLYRGEDENALSAILLDLLGNPARRRSLGEAAFLRASACFAPDRFAIDFRQLMDRALLAGRRPPASADLPHGSLSS
jgi:glycosyltransferase involved in cell wall biosynthesis